jgi:hypothetical protein
MFVLTESPEYLRVIQCITGVPTVAHLRVKSCRICAAVSVPLGLTLIALAFIWHEHPWASNAAGLATTTTLTSSSTQTSNPSLISTSAISTQQYTSPHPLAVVVTTMSPQGDRSNNMRDPPRQLSDQSSPRPPTATRAPFTIKGTNAPTQAATSEQQTGPPLTDPGQSTNTEETEQDGTTHPSSRLKSTDLMNNAHPSPDFHHATVTAHPSPDFHLPAVPQQTGTPVPMIGVHPTHSVVVHPKDMPTVAPHLLSITSATRAPIHHPMRNQPLHASLSTAYPTATGRDSAAAEQGRNENPPPTNSISQPADQAVRSSDAVGVATVPHSLVPVTAPPMTGDLVPPMPGVMPGSSAMGSDVMPTIAEKTMPTFLPDPFATSPVPMASFSAQVEEQVTPAPSTTPSPSELLYMNHDSALSKSVAGSPASMNNPHSRLKDLLDASPGLATLFDKYHRSSDEQKQDLELNNPLLRQVRFFFFSSDGWWWKGNDFQPLLFILVSFHWSHALEFPLVLYMLGCCALLMCLELRLSQVIEAKHEADSYDASTGAVNVDRSMFNYLGQQEPEFTMVAMPTEAAPAVPTSPDTSAYPSTAPEPAPASTIVEPTSPVPLPASGPNPPVSAPTQAVVEDLMQPLPTESFEEIAEMKAEAERRRYHCIFAPQFAPSHGSLASVSVRA